MIYLSGLSRTVPRRVWKKLYRMARVEFRERSKAFSDAMIYGTGFVYVDANGARHVPAAEMFRESREERVAEAFRDLGLTECWLTEC